MSKFVTHAIFNGTKVALNIPGSTVDKVMVKLRRNRLKSIRNAECFLFYKRKTGNLVDSRFA